MISASVAPVGVEVGENQIDAVDMEVIVMPNMCKIMGFYSIPSASCISDALQVVPEEEVTPVQTGVKKWVKALFIILGIAVLGFVGLVVAFAVRARMKEEGEIDEV